MNDEKNELITRWCQKADNDLINIENNMDDDIIPTDTICFHAQQVIEKYLKASLVFYDKEITKTHDLIELYTNIKNFLPELEKYKNELENITGYGVDVRYPDNYYQPTLEEAKEAFDIAKKIKEIIIKKIL